MDKKIVKITLIGPYLRALDYMVEAGIYLDHQTMIMDALRRLFRCYGIKPFYSEPVKKVQE